MRNFAKRRTGKEKRLSENASRVRCRRLLKAFAAQNKQKPPEKGRFLLELMMGVGPMNLVITNDALYQLSYISTHCSRTICIITNLRI